MDLRTKIRPKDTQSSPKSILCQIKNGYLYTNMAVFDGRVGYALTEKELTVVDLFHAQVKSFSLPFDTDSCRPIEFVNKECFLVFDSIQPKLYLFKLDLNELVLTELCSMQLDDRFEGGYFLVDQSELGKFILVAGDDDTLHTGSVIDDQIVLEEVIEPEDYFSQGVLNDSKISSINLVNSSPCQFREFDLKTKQWTLHEVPTKFINGDEFELYHLGIYAWSGRRFYIAYKNEAIYKIGALDTETFKWTDTGIEILDDVWRISVNKDEVLTVVAGGLLSSTTTVYRYPLKKPDTLVNLTWFASTRCFKTTGERRNVPIPLDCDIRAIFPTDKEPKYQVKQLF